MSTGSAGSNAGTETNLDALRSAFAAAMRRSMTGASSTSEALFEMADTVQKSSSQRREESSREQRQADSSHVLGDRKSLDQTDLRNRQLAGEYDGRVDQRRQIESEYHQKLDRIESIAETTIRDILPSAETASTNWSTGNGIAGPAASSSIILPFQNASPPTVSSGGAVASPPTTHLSANDASVVLATATTAINPAVMPTQSTPVLAFPGGIPPTLLGTASVLTIFSVTGRFGQEKNETEKEKEIASSRKKEKKESSLPVFEATVSATPTPAESGPPISSNGGTTDSAAFSTEEIRETAAIPASDARKRNEEKDEAESSTDFSESGPKEKDRESERRGIAFETLFHEKKVPETKTEDAVPTASNFSGTEIVASHGSASSFQSASEDVSESSAEEQMDRVRLIQRVASACQSGAHQNGTVRVKLNLDRLGSLTVRMTKRSDRLDVRFDAETEIAVRLLRENVDELKTFLSERNVHLDQIEFTVGEN